MSSSKLPSHVETPTHLNRFVFRVVQSWELTYRTMWNSDFVTPNLTVGTSAIGSQFSLTAAMTLSL